MKKALILGCTGQLGSFLCELLLEKGYQVYGSMRRSSSPNTNRIDHIFNELRLIYADSTDSLSIDNLIIKSDPDEIYNLSAQSQVRTSFDIPLYTADVDAMGTMRLLESARRHSNAKIYQASSSEMFGSTPPLQSETSPFHPRSPYGVAKVFGYWAAVNYRESFDMYVSNGICFNMESERRGITFVTRKITRGVANIYYKKQRELQLGNLEAKRDWGYCPEYAFYIWKILQQEKPDDFVLATGETHSVREFCELAFKHVGLNYQDYIKQDSRLLRPAEVDILCGNASKAKKKLDFSISVCFTKLVEIMMEYDLKMVRDEK